MIGWIVFGSIVLLFGIVLSLSITFRVQYDEELSISVGVGRLQFALVPAPPKKRKKSKDTPKKPSEKAADKPKKKPEKGNMKETVFLVFDLLKAMWPPFRDLLRQVRITALTVDIVVGGEDAAETAVSYGKICGVLHGSLGALRNLMNLHVKRLNISCNFLQDHTEQTVFFKIKIRIFSVLRAVLRMGWRLLVHTLRRTEKNPSASTKKKIQKPAASTAGKIRRN